MLRCSDKPGLGQRGADPPVLPRRGHGERRQGKAQDRLIINFDHQGAEQDMTQYLLSVARKQGNSGQIPAMQVGDQLPLMGRAEGFIVKLGDGGEVGVGCGFDIHA